MMLGRRGWRRSSSRGIMDYLSLFLAGALLCNAIPHLASGLCGRPLPTPFARPRGVGLSPPLVNFLWGAFNVFIGIGLLLNHPVALGANGETLALAAGALVIGTYLSLHFGRVQRGRP
jgi:hypothetical protein